MFEAIQSRVTGKVVLLLFVLANAVYVAMLSYSIPQLTSFAGGLPIFDVSPFGYTYREAITLLNSLGEEGRSFYLTTQLALDLFYPLLFALCYFSLLQWLMKLIQQKWRVWSAISLVPLLVCVFDYAENVGIWLMLNSHPDLPKVLVTASSLLTVIKSTLTMAYFTGLLVMLILVAIHFYKVRMAKPAG